MTSIVLAEILESLARKLRHGCGNHGCEINPPKGMGTNCCCQCQPRRFSSDLLLLAVEVERQGRHWEKEKP